MENRIIALITDFGTEDGYVGAMKGKILSLAPAVRLVDISHEVSPYNIRQAAFCLHNAYPHFPTGTVFVVVVDPGVGTLRKGILIKTEKYTFVGPDNGVFSFVVEKEAYTAYEIIVSRLPWKVTHTFHGRDVFAPIATMVAEGKNIDTWLQPVDSTSSILSAPEEVGPGELMLEVIHIDHFGNIILNLSKRDWEKLGKPKTVKVTLNNEVLEGIHNTFGDVPPGNFVLTWDSSDYLQIAMNQGRAANSLQFRAGKKVKFIYE